MGSDFWVELFDWNQIEQAKSLGKARIDLEALEPFESVEQVLPLSHHKHGDKGTVRVRLLFSPEIIMKERKNTSTFNTAGRAATQIGHIPMSAGRGVVQGVTGVFRRGKGTNSTVSEDDEDGPATATIEKTPTTSRFLGRKASMASIDERRALRASPSNGALSVDQNGDGVTESGTVRVSIISCKDLGQSDVKPYATVRVGDKEYKTKHGQKTASPEWYEICFMLTEMRELIVLEIQE